MLSCRLLQRSSSMKSNPHVPCRALPWLQSRNPKETHDNWLCKWWVFQFFYLVNYLIWNVVLTCLFMQRPSSTDYIHYAPCLALLWLQPNTELTQWDNWSCKWWVLRIFIFLPLTLICELTCHLLPSPPSYMNYKPNAAPSCGLNWRPIERSRTIDRTNGEFC